MRTKRYFVVYKWMILGLGLKRSELVCYAYAYSQFRNEAVKITEDDLFNEMSIEGRTARNMLLKLFKKGLFKREKIMGLNEAKFCYYPDLEKIKL